MQQHAETLAQIIMYENGRPISGARSEIAYAASFFDWFRGEAQRSYGYTATGSTPGNRIVTIKQPVGVVGILTPWNYPCAMITRKVGAAIAAGCTVVLKPAAETPYSALALAELGERAGLPKGVFNIVTTEANVQEVGTAITTHKDVKKISFTGSTRVGKLLMAQASSTMKKCSFELGGNAPFISQSNPCYSYCPNMKQSSTTQTSKKPFPASLPVNSAAQAKRVYRPTASTSNPVSTTPSSPNSKPKLKPKSRPARSKRMTQCSAA